MKKIIFLISLAVVFCSSCKMDNPGVPPLYVLTLNTEQATMILDVTEPLQLSVTIVPGRTMSKLILEWESSDPLVAEVDQDGLVTATGVGETTITVRATSGNATLTATCAIEVIPEWKSLGMGEFYDSFVTIDIANGIIDVEVQQSNVNPNTYRVLNPYPFEKLRDDWEWDDWCGGPKSEEIVFWEVDGKVVWDECWYAGILYKANPDDQIKHYYPSALSPSLARYNEKSLFLQEKLVRLRPAIYIDGVGGWHNTDYYTYISFPGGPDLFTYLTTCEDSRDGKVYNTVTLGTQTWMAENLAYLPSVVGPATDSETEPYYYVYGYDGTDVEEAKATENYQTYGVLYNWSAALTACPEGWHLPSDAEWTQLENYLANNGHNYDGTKGGVGAKIAKSLASETGWNSSSVEGAIGNTGFPEYRNKSGFSALPGGARTTNGGFNYYKTGYYGYWWSSTQGNPDTAWSRFLCFSLILIGHNHYTKESGYSVRCVRD
ncbi:MAG: FISUMP domain-containing protein [Bacteroidales bacterium]|jgi:uncharacterized protein (TIGR02145 family)